MEKDVNDDDNEDDGDEKREDDFLDALGDRCGGVQGNNVIDVAGEALLGFHHHFLESVGGLDSVGARKLVGGDDRAGLAVEAAEDAVVLSTKLDARHVLDAHNTAAGIFAHDNLAKLFWGRK